MQPAGITIIRARRRQLVGSNIGAGNNLLLNRCGHWLVPLQLHAVLRPALGHAPQVGDVVEPAAIPWDSRLLPSDVAARLTIPNQREIKLVPEISELDGPTFGTTHPKISPAREELGAVGSYVRSKGKKVGL